MKKLLVFCLSFVLLFSSCADKSALPKFTEMAVIGISVSTLPKSDASKRTVLDAEELRAILEYIDRMTLTSDFRENPDEYDGMTVVCELLLADGTTKSLYAFGNMFLRLEGEPWLRMEYEEAVALADMLLP